MSWTVEKMIKTYSPKIIQYNREYSKEIFRNGRRAELIMFNSYDLMMALETLVENDDLTEQGKTIALEVLKKIEL